MSNELAVERDVVAAAYAAEVELGGRMNRREMRRAGLTVLNVRRRARQLAIAGEITSDMSHEQIRDIVIDDLQGDEPRAFQQLSAIDWDKVIAFIEKLIPLILKIISMFGL
jgi:phage FluMu protein gp41